MREGGYTYEQFLSFFKASHTNKMIDKKDTVCGMRAATQATNKGFKKYIQDLDISMKTKSEQNKPVTRQALRGLSRMMGGK